ncbi:MAG: hypothetical protein NVSMB29_06070 [Candidatus Dormibacteria bacterium]
MALRAEREIPAVTEAVARLVDAMRGLTTEVSALRTENDKLQAEVTKLRALPKLRGRDARVPRPVAGRPNGNGRHPVPGRGLRRPSPGGRATPPEVTEAVVRAALNKLGEATAAEIAAEITRAGSRVSGRAIRFLAERAGAQVVTDAAGQRRYRLI